MTRVYSRYVAGLEVRVPAGQTAQSLAEAADRQWLAGIAAERLGVANPVITEEQALVYVDFGGKSREGIPAIQLTIQTKPEFLMDVTIGVLDGEVLRVVARTVEYAAKPKIYTGVAYEAFTSTGCGGAPYYLCIYPTGCSFDTYSPYKCENQCSTDSECNSAYTGWKCWTSDPTFPYYCYKDEYNQNAAFLYIYDRDHWVQTAYSYLRRFSDLLTKMNDLITFHYYDLGRNSWDNNNADYNIYLVSFCSCDSPPCHYREGCPYLANTDGNGTVRWVSWSHLAPETDINMNNRNSYDILGHEYGHCIVNTEAGGSLLFDCLNENVPELYGILLAVKKVGDSSVRWTGSCSQHTINENPWGDEINGLSPGCTSLPYSLRSRLDWYCGEGGAQGTYLNAFIWSRFLRVLSEGPLTFSNDGTNENVGVTFTGIGNAETIDVVYEATTNLMTSTDLEDWLDLITSAGNTHGVYSQTLKALGVAGFIADGERLTTSKSDKATYQYYFGAYTVSSIKTFLVWKDRTTFDIKVLRHNGSNWVTDTISANTDSAPAVTVYNDRLHIFWRDRSSAAIKFRYYRYDGTVYGTYDLSSKGITTVGSFDAAVFNNYLYIVYSYGANNDVYLSKCSSASGCTNTTWYDFGSANFKKSLGYTAYPGMGVDMGSAINGTGANNYLYIASASTLPNYDHRIRVDQVGTDDNLRHTGFVVWVPSTYPSYKTSLEIGLKAVTAAFPSATTYLYLSWRDYSTSAIYVSVVQKYNDGDNSDTQITKSADTFLDSYTGVRIQKGDGASTDKTVISSTETTYVPLSSWLWGRY